MCFVFFLFLFSLLALHHVSQGRMRGGFLIRSSSVPHPFLIRQSNVTVKKDDTDITPRWVPASDIPCECSAIPPPLLLQRENRKWNPSAPAAPTVFAPRRSLILARPRLGYLASMHAFRQRRLVRTGRGRPGHADDRPAGRGTWQPGSQSGTDRLGGGGGIQPNSHLRRLFGHVPLPNEPKSQWCKGAMRDARN